MCLYAGPGFDKVCSSKKAVLFGIWRFDYTAASSHYWLLPETKPWSLQILSRSTPIDAQIRNTGIQDCMLSDLQPKVSQPNPVPCREILGAEQPSTTKQTIWSKHNARWDDPPGFVMVPQNKASPGLQEHFSTPQTGTQGTNRVRMSGKIDESNRRRALTWPLATQLLLARARHTGQQQQVLVLPWKLKISGYTWIQNVH